MPDLIPKTMKISFTANGIKSADRKLMNNKSPGKDGISAKLIKCAPDILHKQITKIYNNVAETGEHLNKITNDILRPL